MYSTDYYYRICQIFVVPENFVGMTFKEMIEIYFI